MKRLGQLMASLILYFFCLEITACNIKLRLPMQSYPPAFIQNPDGAWTGFSVEWALILLEEAGCNHEFVQLPFKRALASLKQGKVDMMVNLSLLPEREQYIYFVGPIIYEEVVMATIDESDESVTSLQDIKKLPKPVAVEIGMSYGDAFKTLYDNDESFRNKIISVQNIKQSALMLLANRVSGFLTQRRVIVHKININPVYSSFKVVNLNIRSTPNYFGFSKKSVDRKLLKRFTQAFRRAQRNDRPRKIVDKYFMPELKGKR